MKARIIGILEILCVGLYLGACGKQASESPVPEETALSRLHRRFHQQPSPQLSLVNQHPEIIHQAQLGDSPWASWILYDSREMAVQLDLEPRAILQYWLASYGLLIGSTEAGEWQSLRTEKLNNFYKIYHYQRFLGDIPVRDSFLQIILSQDAEKQWRIVEMRANATGPLVEADVEPVLEDYKLLLHYGLDKLIVESKEQEWIPFANGSSFVYELATSFQVLDTIGDQRVMTVLHKDGHILENYSLSLHMKSIQARALKRSYRDAGPREYPLSFGTIYQGSKTSVLGPEALNDMAIVQAVGLQGSRVIINDANGLVPVFTSVSDQETHFLLSSQSYDFAAVNAFVAVQRINRFVRQFVDPDQLRFLDDAVRVVVNSEDGSCNAFYSPKSQRILLYKEDSECANMALLNDVIFHEWGHALDDHTGLTPGIVDYAFSEGVSDTLAAFYNEDPEIAPGFFFNDPSGVRSTNNDRLFPRDTGSTHFEGGIISGAFWDLRQELIAQEGKRRGAHIAGQLFMRHLQIADSYSESYAAVLRLDDDDGRPETPSPHACIIQKAFSQHGLAPAPEKPCTLPVQELAAVDQHIQMTLWEDPELKTSVRLLVSSLDATHMVYCWASRLSCSQEPALRRKLSFLESSPERRFYASDSLKLPARLNTLTVLSLNAAGELVAGREFVLHDK